MKLTRILLYLTLLAPLAFISCKDENNDGPKPDHKNYFPLRTGAWRIYQVDSVGRPTPNNDTVSIHFQIQEVIDSAYTDGADKKMYKILRYKRANDTEPWKLIEIVSAGIEGSEAIFQEGNSRRVKLVFPVENGRMWNANLYNSEDPNGYYHSKYTAVHQKYTDTAGHTFDSTAYVELNKEEIAIYSDYKAERYATGVGLIDFRHDSVTTQGKSFWIRKRIVSFQK